MIFRIITFIFLPLLTFQLTASDHAREQRWAAQIVDDQNEILIQTVHRWLANHR